MRKFGGWIFAEPGNKKLGDFFVFDGVAVRWVGDIEVVFRNNLNVSENISKPIQRMPSKEY